jgi:hypothetical protein
MVVWLERQPRGSSILGKPRIELFSSAATSVISPRLSRASMDGCSTEKDVHPVTDL